MQATMNVQPLSFEERFASYESRPRKTSTFSSHFTTEPQELEPLGDGVPLARKKHHHQVHFFDEALDEDGEASYDLDGEPEEEEWEDEDEEPVLPKRRRYLSEAEYQREATDYTRQQLKQSGLYYKHAYHFWRLRSRDSFDHVRPPLVKVLIAFAVLIVPIMLGLYLANDGVSFGAKPDISMLPDLAQNHVPVRHRFVLEMQNEKKRYYKRIGLIAYSLTSMQSNYVEQQEAASRRGGLLNRLLRKAGLVAKRDNDTAEALVPAPLASPAQDAAKPAPSPVAQQQEELKESETINHVGVYEEPGLTLTSILPSMQGMNIFSFAYTAAIDFFSKTFGWESPNVTATAA